MRESGTGFGLDGGPTQGGGCPGGAQEGEGEVPRRMRGSGRGRRKIWANLIRVSEREDFQSAGLFGDLFKFCGVYFRSAHLRTVDPWNCHLSRKRIAHIQGTTFQSKGVSIAVDYLPKQSIVNESEN